MRSAKNDSSLPILPILVRITANVNFIHSHASYKILFYGSMQYPLRTEEIVP